MVGRSELPSRPSAERELSSWAIDIRVSFDACCQMQRRIVKELRIGESSWEDRAEELSGQLKNRILNLRNAITARRFKLPEYIMVDVPSIIPEDDRKVLFLPYEGKLVLAPQVEKIILFNQKLVPDFSKAQEAPERQWILAGSLAVQLLSFIPSFKIKNQIMKEG